MAAHSFLGIFNNMLPIMDVMSVLFLLSLSGWRGTLPQSLGCVVNPGSSFVYNLIEYTIQGLSAFFSFYNYSVVGIHNN